VTSGRDAVRRTRVVVEGLRDDLAFTIRALRRMPIFTATVVVTLAFGIGGNVATLSLIDRLLFRAPPGVADSKLVRRVYAQLSIAGDASYFSEHFSVPDFLALAAAVNQQADVEAFTTSRDLPLGDGRIRVTVGHVSAGFLSELGLHAARGRLFTAEENRIGDPRPVALMSHSLWTNAFGGDSAILGQTVTVDGTRVTIVGVLPRNFVGITLDPVDLWMPLAAAAMQGGEPSGWTRNAVFLELVARLRPGVQDAALEQRLTAIFRSAEPRRRRTARIVTAPLLAARGPVPLLPSVERNLSLAKHLYAVSSMVLLVAAVNVASLLLLRAVHRRREISIRIALGVSMRRLQAQLVIETLVLALGAGSPRRWSDGGVRCFFPSACCPRWNGVHRRWIPASSLSPWRSRWLRHSSLAWRPRGSSSALASARSFGSKAGQWIGPDQSCAAPCSSCRPPCRSPSSRARARSSSVSTVLAARIWVSIRTSSLLSLWPDRLISVRRPWPRRDCARFRSWNPSRTRRLTRFRAGR
jgi:hypothetical protein